MSYPKTSFAIAFAIVTAFMLASCAELPAAGRTPESYAKYPASVPGKPGPEPAPTARPYVTTFPVSLAHDPHDPYSQMYFSRPRSVTISADLHNPFPHDAIATVYCPGDIFEGHSIRNVFVRAYGERFFLVQMSSIHMHDGCTVDFFHFVGTPGPAADF